MYVYMYMGGFEYILCTICIHRREEDFELELVSHHVGTENET